VIREDDIDGTFMEQDIINGQNIGMADFRLNFDLFQYQRKVLVVRLYSLYQMLGSSKFVLPYSNFVNIAFFYILQKNKLLNAGKDFL
jgi:hypothetical protein